MADTENNTMPQRYKSIDVAKGIGILLVIIAHVLSNVPEFAAIKTVIYSFHMPLFFLISGFLFNQKKYSAFKSFMKQRFRTLIIPYLCFAFLSLLYYAIKSVYNFKLSDIMKNFLQIFISQYSLKFKINIPMWFVLCLLLVEIIYFFISKIRKPVIFWAVIILLVFSGWFLESDFMPIDTSFLPWNMCSAFFAIGFYALGNKAKPLIRYFEDNQKPAIIKIICIAVSAAVVLVVSLLNGEISIGHRVLNNGFLLYITGVSGSIMVLLISYFLSNCRVLTFFGKNSFYFMSVHYLIRDAIEDLLSLYSKFSDTEFHLSRYSLSDTLIMLAIDLIICILLVIIINKIKNSSVFLNQKAKLPCIK